MASKAERKTEGGGGIVDALKRRNVMIANSQWQWLREKSFHQERSISELIREAIEIQMDEAA